MSVRGHQLCRSPHASLQAKKRERLITPMYKGQGQGVDHLPISKLARCCIYAGLYKAYGHACSPSAPFLHTKRVVNGPSSIVADNGMTQHTKGLVAFLGRCHSGGNEGSVDSSPAGCRTRRLTWTMRMWTNRSQQSCESSEKQNELGGMKSRGSPEQLTKGIL